jgi:hypothetical protein
MALLFLIISFHVKSIDFLFPPFGLFFAILAGSREIVEIPLP